MKYNKTSPREKKKYSKFLFNFKKTKKKELKLFTFKKTLEVKPFKIKKGKFPLRTFIYCLNWRDVQTLQEEYGLSHDLVDDMEKQMHNGLFKLRKSVAKVKLNSDTASIPYSYLNNIVYPSFKRLTRQLGFDEGCNVCMAKLDVLKWKYGHIKTVKEWGYSSQNYDLDKICNAEDKLGMKCYYEIFNIEDKFDFGKSCTDLRKEITQIQNEHLFNEVKRRLKLYIKNRTLE